jgi:hypothetical protein
MRAITARIAFVAADRRVRRRQMRMRLSLERPLRRATRGVWTRATADGRPRNLEAGPQRTLV